MKERYPLVKNTASFFVVLCIIFIPFPFSLASFQLQLTDFFFGKLIGIVSKNLFGIELKNTKVYSDSVSMYILALLLFILSVVIASALTRISKWKQYRAKILIVCYNVCCYYLALQLLKYGVGKIFKQQFYLPEPNTLYTSMGQVSKDLLYWSSMGTSYSYNVFAGLIEVVTALLLLFKRTRLIGLLIAFAALLHIVALNFGFDISVKLYSLFLLFLCLYLLAPYCISLYHFFWLHKNPADKPIDDNIVLLKHSFAVVFIKSLIVGLVLAEVFYPFVKTRNFNDDLATRPFLHGAYEVTQLIQGTDTLALASSPVKRFFIHRNGYIIFQNPKDEMEDFKLTYEKEQQQFILQDYQLHTTRLKYSYQPKDSTLTLQYFNAGKEYKLSGKALEWRKLPALQKGFHWTADGD